MAPPLAIPKPQAVFLSSDGKNLFCSLRTIFRVGLSFLPATYDLEPLEARVKSDLPYLLEGYGTSEQDAEAQAKKF